MRTLSLGAILTLAVAACSGGGGGGGSGDGAAASAPPSSAPPASSASFATRCSQPGVLVCVGFDSAADIAGKFGDNSGLDKSGAADPVLDTSVKASGASSLKMTIPSNSDADTSGSYFANFSSDLSVQFSENAEFYVQWRQRFSPEFLNTVYTGISAGIKSPTSNGWKQIIISAGDQPGCTSSHATVPPCQPSCTALETVVQNGSLRGFPGMYNSCTGSSSHGPFDAFEEHFGAFDFKLQNARPSPFCLRSQGQTNPTTFFPPTGNCFGYFPNEWMTFQIRIKTGPRMNDEWTNSFVTLWMAREGQPSQAVITWGPYNLSAGSAADNLKYGKVWLLPYQTNKDPSQVTPVAFTWYDELIISRTQIPDPQ